MSNFKKKWKAFWKLVWEFVKQSFAPGVMNFVAGMVVMIILAKMEEEINLDKLLTWSVVCGLVSVAYGGLLSFACGGMHFEMLVSGNMKRQSDYELNISSHKIEKEYRPWKGFLIGLFSAWPIVVGGLVLGANQRYLLPEATFPKGVSGLVLVFDLLAGAVLLPVQMYNRMGVYVNGYLSCLFVLVPVVVLGGCYIWGSYAKRGKRLRQHEMQKREMEAEQNKPKKINYGGLPGTKPKKKR